MQSKSTKDWSFQRKSDPVNASLKSSISFANIGSNSLPKHAFSEGKITLFNNPMWPNLRRETL